MRKPAKNGNYRLWCPTSNETVEHYPYDLPLSPAQSKHAFSSSRTYLSETVEVQPERSASLDIWLQHTAGWELDSLTFKRIQSPARTNNLDLGTRQSSQPSASGQPPVASRLKTGVWNSSTGKSQSACLYWRCFRSMRLFRNSSRWRRLSW